VPGGKEQACQQRANKINQSNNLVSSQKSEREKMTMGLAVAKRTATAVGLISMARSGVALSMEQPSESLPLSMEQPSADGFPGDAAPVDVLPAEADRFLGAGYRRDEPAYDKDLEKRPTGNDNPSGISTGIKSEDSADEKNQQDEPIEVFVAENKLQKHDAPTEVSVAEKKLKITTVTANILGGGGFVKDLGGPDDQAMFFHNAFPAFLNQFRTGGRYAVAKNGIVFLGLQEEVCVTKNLDPESFPVHSNRDTHKDFEPWSFTSKMLLGSGSEQDWKLVDAAGNVMPSNYYAADYSEVETAKFYGAVHDGSPTKSINIAQQTATKIKTGLAARNMKLCNVVWMKVGSNVHLTTRNANEAGNDGHQEFKSAVKADKLVLAAESVINTYDTFQQKDAPAATAIIGSRASFGVNLYAYDNELETWQLIFCLDDAHLSGGKFEDSYIVAELELAKNLGKRQLENALRRPENEAAESVPRVILADTNRRIAEHLAHENSYSYNTLRGMLFEKNQAQFHEGGETPDYENLPSFNFNLQNIWGEPSDDGTVNPKKRMAEKSTFQVWIDSIDRDRAVEAARTVDTAFSLEKFADAKAAEYFEADKRTSQHRDCVTARAGGETADVDDAEAAAQKKGCAEAVYEAQQRLFMKYKDMWTLHLPDEFEPLEQTPQRSKGSEELSDSDELPDHKRFDTAKPGGRIDHIMYKRAGNILRPTKAATLHQDDTIMEFNTSGQAGPAGFHTTKATDHYFVSAEFELAFSGLIHQE